MARLNNFRLIPVVVLSLLAMSCEPKRDKPFQPFPTGRGWTDTSRPNCGAGYAAFETYARKYAWGLSGYEAMQPTVVEDSTKPTLWAKVKVYAVQASGDLYIFTRFGHPAHPAVLIKSVVITSEGVSWDVVGCPWGARGAYRRFAGASQALTDGFMAEIEAHPSPLGKVTYPLGQSPEENEEVHVETAAQMIGAMADRALALKSDQRFMNTLYAFTKLEGGMGVLYLTWAKEPPSGADRYAIIDAAIVDYQSNQGPRATAAWCNGPDGKRTPRFCAAAAAETKRWLED